MPYFQIADFRGGLDTRRARDLAPPGTLRTLLNGFINDGAEIEKRPEFVKDTALTALLQGATVAANIAAGSAAAADGRPIGPFPGLSETEILFAGVGDEWIGAQNILSTISGLPVPTAYYTKLLANGGGSLDPASRIRAQSETEFDGSNFIIANVSGTVRRFLITQAPDSEASVEDLASVVGNYAMTHGQKMYTVNDTLLSASHLGEPTDFSLPAVPPLAGAFLTLLRGQDARIGAGQALAAFYSELVVFGKKGIQFWAMDPDPDQNQYLRTIPKDGIIAPRANAGFGDGDVAFLARSGVRSLQARDSSNLAAIGDVGSPIDRILRPTLREASLVGSAVPQAIMHTNALTGQLWVIIGRSIYVLSNHPESKVLAWSQYQIPSPTPLDSDGWIEDIADLGGTVILRNRAREVFVYGGPLFDQYDSTQVIAETPHLNFGTPGHRKDISGIDVGCVGEWRIELSFQAQNIDQTTGVANPIAWEEVARVKGSTYDTGTIPVEAEATHIAVRATSLNAGEATLGEVLVHFAQEDAS